MSASTAFGAWNDASNRGVLFYGVVSAQTEKVVEFFLEHEGGRGDDR